MSVLIAYDGSAPARAAVRAAAELLPGGEAVVLTVYTTSARLDAFASAKASDPSAIDAMNGALAQLERETQHEAMAVAREGAGLAAEGGFAAEAQTVASRGSAWPLILEASTQRGSALLVCGTRGRGALSRAVLGSTSTALLHHTTLPILVVPERSSEVSGPVLIAYDGSAPARSAVETAAELFDGRSAVVVHVWESPMRHSRSGRLLGSAPITEARELTEELDEILASSAQQQAEEGAELARRRGLEARAEAVESASGVWRALIEAAVSTGTGVVAAGSRGRGAIASAVLGSVASGLVHNAELPVLIVPPSSESPL